MQQLINILFSKRVFLLIWKSKCYTIIFVRKQQYTAAYILFYMEGNPSEGRRLLNISPSKEKANILSAKDAVPRSQCWYVTFEQDSQLTFSSTAQRYTHIYVVCTFHRPSPESDVCRGNFSRAPSDAYRSAHAKSVKPCLPVMHAWLHSPRHPWLA